MTKPTDLGIVLMILHALSACSADGDETPMGGDDLAPDGTPVVDTRRDAADQTSTPNTPTLNPGKCDPAFLGPFCTSTTCDASGTCVKSGNNARIIGFEYPAPMEPTLVEFRAYSLAAVNFIRARTCLPPLAPDDCLDGIADEARAASSGHGYFLANCMNSDHAFGRECKCNWTQENIGGASGTNRSWIDGVHSPLCGMMTEKKGRGHRSNIEHPSWTRMGISASWSRSGASWFHEFGCDNALASCPKD
jgi:uncharacterized protein YkwD